MTVMRIDDADLAAHLLDRLVERQAHDRLAVERGDEVARLQAGFGGGRAVHRRHHLDQAVFHRDFDAKAAELALGLDLHVAEVFLVQVARMRIERGQHAVDRGLDQLLVVRRLDVVVADRARTPRRTG